MLSGESHRRYRGLRITVRWKVATDTPIGHLFTASYSISELDGKPSPWREFPDRDFHTGEYAMRFALAEARRSINQMLEPREIPR